MARKRPTLQEVQRLYPSDMARCAGYTWHLGTRIGKGSFGEVYMGWSQDGRQEVAVKAVSKSFFKQDPKVKENLEREIRIMKLLKNCEYVVRLEHVQVSQYAVSGG
jgi:serine/threonine protein kinase